MVQKYIKLDMTSLLMIMIKKGYKLSYIKVLIVFGMNLIIKKT